MMSSMNVIFLVIAALCVPIIIAGVVLMARWVYLDAKSRGVNPWPWVLFVLLISPNFIGLIVYALVRPQNRSRTACPHCGADVPLSANYCPGCAVRNENRPDEPPPRGPGKRLLVIGFALLFAGLIAIVGLMFGGLMAFSDAPFASVGTYTIGSVESSWGDSWQMSFQTFQGRQEKTFTAGDSNPRLVYASEITKGDLTIDVLDGDGKLFTTLYANESGELGGLTPGERYRVVVTAEKAGGKFEFKME